jgi:hypothetical protein
MTMTKTSEASDQTIELFRIGESKSPLVVSINHFKGQRFVDIRRYYYDTISKTTKPTPKGIALKEDEFVALFEFFKSSFDDIYNSFTTSLASTELTKRSSRQEKLARSVEGKKIAASQITIDSWSGPNFFKYALSANSTKVALNGRNPIVKKLVEGDLSPEEVARHLLAAYAKAASDLEFSSRIGPKDFTEFLEISWGNALR